MNKVIKLIKMYSGDIIRSFLAALDITILLWIVFLWPVVVAFIL